MMSGGICLPSAHKFSTCAMNVYHEASSSDDLILADFCCPSHVICISHVKMAPLSLLKFNQCRLTPTVLPRADDKWLAIILFRLLPREILLSGLISYMTRGKLRRRDLRAYLLISTLGLSLFWWLILSKVLPRWEVHCNYRQIILSGKLLLSVMHINESRELLPINQCG